MKNRKSQAALEFLMTYGWAILVVLVVIGALAYFGVLDPSKLLPEKCTLQMGLYCKDHQISQTNGNINLKLENGMGKGIIMTDINVTGEAFEDGCFSEVGEFDSLTGILNCDATTCSACTAASGMYYGCNPEVKMNASYNNKIGWRIANGYSDDIVLTCTSMIDYTGKTKANIEIKWFYDDSTPQYTHTMEGEMLATVEQ